MLVSHVCRFIYLKTIKTASTSVEMYFEPYCVDPAAWMGEEHERRELISDYGIVGARGAAQFTPEHPTWYNHMPASELAAQLPAKVWDTYTRFCVVRNPWDKVVSQFWYHQTPSDRAALARGDFSTARQALTNWLKTGRLPLDRSVYTLGDDLAVQHTIRYENLLPEVEAMCRRLGIPWQPQRFGRYKSGYRPRPELARDYFDSAAAERIRELFAWEFRKFLYDAT